MKEITIQEIKKRFVSLSSHYEDKYEKDRDNLLANPVRNFQWYSEGMFRNAYLFSKFKFYAEAADELEEENLAGFIKYLQAQVDSYYQGYVTGRFEFNSSSSFMANATNMIPLTAKLRYSGSLLATLR